MAKELTFGQIRDGIIMSLHTSYPNAPIFSDTAPQDVVDGSFNVVLVSTREREKLTDYRKHSVTFDVVYYADHDNVTDDMLRISTDLPLLLETITTPSGAKAHPEGEISPVPQDDETLHCFVTYTYNVIAKRVHYDDEGHEIFDTDLMRHLTIHLPAEVDE